MQSRLAALKRLASLYGDVEEMQSSELQRSSAAMRETEQAIGIERHAVRSSHVEGRRALDTGSLLDWRAAQLQREAATWRQQRLQQVQRQQELLNDEVRKRYLASRLQSEQTKHIVQGVAQEMEVESGRRTQSATDDRFLARRRWSDRQTERTARIDEILLIHD